MKTDVIILSSIFHIRFSESRDIDKVDERCLFGGSVCNHSPTLSYLNSSLKKVWRLCLVEFGWAVLVRAGGIWTLSRVIVLVHSEQMFSSHCCDCYKRLVQCACVYSFICWCCVGENLFAFFWLSLLFFFQWRRFFLGYILQRDILTPHPSSHHTFCESSQYFILTCFLSFVSKCS